MNGAASCLASRGELGGLVQKGWFLLEGGRARKLPAKVNKGLFQARSPFLWRKGRGLRLPLGAGEGLGDRGLLGADQKVADPPGKTHIFGGGWNGSQVRYEGPVY